MVKAGIVFRITTAALLAAVMLCSAAVATQAKVPAKAGAPALAGISAKAYVLIEAVTGERISGSNDELPLPMASTTKIMTAYLTLCEPNLDVPFVVDENAIKVEGTSMGLTTGAQVTLRALACGMLLPSGNDAANAAACKISGSITAFAEKMNEKADEIGMNNTHFVTPSGLDDNEHFSSAFDMALLAREALKNPDFAAICRSESIKLSYGNPPAPRRLTNHNRLLKMYEGCIGVKTGFTKKAGRCLVSAAQRNGVTLICVTLNATNDWQDHKALLDSGFESVKLVKNEVSLVKDMALASEIKLPVVGGAAKAVAIAPLFYEYESVVKQEKITDEIYLPRFVYAPLQSGEVVGQIRHMYQGEVIAVTPLVAGNAVAIQNKEKEKPGFFEKLKGLFRF